MHDDQEVNPYLSPTAHRSGERFKGIVFPLWEEVTITADVLADAHIARYGKGSLVIRVVSGIVGALTTGLTILLATEIYQGNVSRTVVATLFPFFVLTSLGLWTWALGGARALRRTLVRTHRRRSQAKLLYQFTAEEVQLRSSVDDTDVIYRHSWNEFVKRKEHAGVVLLFTSRAHCFVFPTDQMSTSAQDVLREIT